MISIAPAVRALLCVGGLALLPVTAQAQTYPSKPIRLILPYTPGGIIDYVGRTLAQKLTENLGQQVVAENRPGAGGVVGTDFVARAAPDGYTIVLTDPGVVILPTLQPDTPFDPFKNLTAISIVGSSPVVLVVSPKLPVKNFAELLAYGKANPGKLNYASAGIGTAPHLAGEMFNQRTGIDAQHVPYRGIGTSFPDIMSGKVQMAFSSIAGALPFTKDNRIIAVATTGRARSAVYPDLPTIHEAGLPGFEVDLWTGIFGPAGIPPATVDKLNNELKKTLQDPAVKAALDKVGVEARGTTLDEGAKFVRVEYDKWRQVIVEGKIKPN